MAGLRAKVLLALLFIFVSACVTADGAARSDMALSQSRALIGFDAEGAMILHAGADIRAFDLPHGPERTLISIDGPVSDALMRSLIREQGWRGAKTWQPDVELTLVSRVDPGLGDRRSMRIYGEADGNSILLQRIPIIGATRVERIVRSPDDRFAIVVVRSNEGERFVVIDVRRAKATLLDQRAIEAYAAGDPSRAASLLERAVEVDPSAGNAIYNLACMHALLGDVHRAADELRIALSIDAGRYRLLAKNDPDLAAVRELPAIKAILGVP
jgi:hypothetical protein